MASVNKVILVGNLGADPEVRKLPSGDSIANLSIATTDKFRDKQSGEMREITEWHRVNMFGKLADIAAQYLRKGSQVYIEGSIRTRKWQDQSGQTRYSTEVRADIMQMLGSKADAHPVRQQPTTPPPTSYGAPKQAQPAAQATAFDDMNDDVPF